MSRSYDDRWIIVGAGASGMAAAWFLRQQGIDAEIVEKDGAVGGRMGALQLGDRRVDFGGKNLGRKYKLFRAFVASLGQHEFEYFGLNSSQVRNGRIVTFDAKRRWRTLIQMARDASVRDALLFARLLRKTRSVEENGYLGSECFGGVGSRYDQSPAARYFSREFCRRIIRPMSVRMNGAEPDEIYLGNLGSNIRMILDSFDQLRNGLAPLLEDFRKAYKVRLNTSVERLILTGGRLSAVRVRHESGATEDLSAGGVILATPAPVSAKLIDPFDSVLARNLRRVAYYPVGLILAEYDRPVFTPEVRSLVFDDDEPLSNAGAYGISDLNLVRYTFSGRAARRHLNGPAGAEDLLRAGESALNRYFPVGKAQRRRFEARRFALGLCAYTPFQSEFLSGLKARTAETPGLYLTGDYIQGASLEACFRAAKNCVEEISRTDSARHRDWEVMYR